MSQDQFISTILDLIPLYENIDDNVNTIYELSGMFFQEWSFQQLKSTITWFKNILPLNDQIELAKNVQFSDPSSALCFNCITALSQHRLPAVIRPSGLVSDEVYFKYIFTVIKLIDDHFETLDINDIVMALEQFINTLIEELGIFLEQSNSLHIEFIYTALKLLIAVNKTQQKFEISPFVNFLIKGATVCDKWLRIQIITLITQHRLIFDTMKQHTDDLLKIMFQSTNDVLVQINGKILPTKLQLNLSILLHMTVELIENVAAGNNLSGICSIISSMCVIQINNSSIFDQIMTNVISSCIIFIEKISEVIQSSPNEIYIIEQNQSVFSQMLTKLTNFSNLVFTQLQVTPQLKMYAHKFNQYYIKFIQFLQEKNINTTSYTVQQISIFDFKESNQSDLIAKGHSFDQIQEKQDVEFKDNNYNFQNEQQRLNQLFLTIINIPLGKSREEILEQTRLAVNIDEFLPEHGSLVQFYAKTELPAALIRLLTNVFIVENSSNKQIKDILLHPGFEACLNILKRFIKQPSAVKTIALADYNFFIVVGRVIQWFNEYYYLEEKIEVEQQKFLYQQLDTIIKLLFAATKLQGLQFCHILVKSEITKLLLLLLTNERTYELKSDIPFKSVLILHFTIEAVSKYYNQLYNNNQNYPDLNTQFYIPTTIKALRIVTDNKSMIINQKQVLIAGLCYILAQLCDISNDTVVYLCQHIDLIKNITNYVTSLIVSDQVVVTETKELFISSETLHSIVSLIGSFVDCVMKLKHDEIDKQLLYDTKQFIQQQLFAQATVENIVKKLQMSCFPKYQPKCYFLLYLANALIFNLTDDKLKTSLYINSELAQNILYEIWSVISYNLNLATILFIIPKLFGVLQQTKYSSYFCAQLILRGYIGCQSRPKKQWAPQEQLQDLLAHASFNLKQLFDEFSFSKHCLNTRIDQDFSRIAYLAVLGSQAFNCNVTQALMLFDPLDAQEIIENGFIKLFEEPKQSFHAVFQLLQKAIKDTPMSLTTIHFILLILNIVSYYDLNREMWWILEQQLNQISLELVNYWDIKIKIILQEINNEIQESVIQHQKLYPNKTSKPVKCGQDSIIFFDTQYVIQHFLNFQQKQVLTKFSLFSGIWQQIVYLFNQRELITFIDKCGPFQLGILFRKQIKMLQFKKQDYNGLKQCQQQIQFSYEQIYNLFQKIIYQMQNNKQQINTNAINKLRQSLQLLQLAIISTPDTFSDLYNIICKHLGTDISMTNFKFDESFNVRVQRTDYHLTNMPSSQFNKIVSLDEDFANQFLLQLPDVTKIEKNLHFSETPIVDIVETFGVIPLMQYVHEIISIYTPETPKQYLVQLLEYLDKYLEKHHYDCIHNEKMIISEILIRDLIKLHVQLQSTELIEQCFSILIQLSSLKINQKSTLLFTNNYLFLTAYSCILQQKYSLTPLHLQTTLQKLNKFFCKLKEENGVIINNQRIEEKYQMQEKRISNYLVSDMNPLFQNLILTSEIDRYIDSVAIQSVQKIQEKDMSFNTFFDQFTTQILQLLNVIFDDCRTNYVDEVLLIVNEILNIHHLYGDICPLNTQYSVTKLIVQAFNFKSTAVYHTAELLLMSLHQYIFSYQQPQQKQYIQQAITLIIFTIVSFYDSAVDDGKLLHQLLTLPIGMLTFDHFDELAEYKDDENLLFECRGQQEKVSYIEHRLAVMLMNYMNNSRNQYFISLLVQITNDQNQFRVKFQKKLLKNIIKIEVNGV
ncbi:Conserved_hypothetical protein [Hexamita inflata]|uniref:Uncharacterized protein n=1 Tax=Hexamita inflata TaxID=28002 RepID=A0AA86PUT2_9EUKA|nr:Conserved hypothetical protein [Hexamita inflata]